MNRTLAAMVFVLTGLLATAACTTPERARGGGGNTGILCAAEQQMVCKDAGGVVCEAESEGCICTCVSLGSSCVSSADCVGGQQCLSQSNQCVTPCSSDAQCPGTECIGNTYCAPSRPIGSCEDEGGTYVCTDDETGAICGDTEDPACTCICVYSEPPPPPECAEDADCNGEQICVAGDCVRDVPPSAYRYVMIEDLQSPVSGDYPGADIDSVDLIKSDGAIVYATDIEDHENMTEAGNLATDPTQVLGGSDADCDPNSGAFYAMGGEGSWMILSFGDGAIENGDAIDVVELGSTECGRFDDDDFAVGISLAADDAGTWIEVGNCHGSCTALVSGL